MSIFINRIKQWLGYENITNTDLNAEFNNVLQNTGSDSLSGANSTGASLPTVNAMRTTLSTGTVGSETLAYTAQQDIQQIRFVLNEIIGGAQWYSTPIANLSTISSATNLPQSRVVSGRSVLNQPMYLVAGGSTNSLTLKATSTNFAAYFNGVLTTLTNDLTVTGLSLAPAANNTCLVNDASLVGQQYTKTLGERFTNIPIDTIGNQISALNGQYAAFKTNAGGSDEYFTARVDSSNNQLTHAFRGVAFTSADNWTARVALSDNQTITLLKLIYCFASTTPGVGITYNQPIVSYVAPTTPGIGDYWYDIANATWKVFSGTAFVASDSVFIGIAMTDTANCVGARSDDFFRIPSALNTIELEAKDNVTVRASSLNTKVSVYGTQFNWDVTVPDWSTTAGVSGGLDPGISLTPNTTYWCYVTDLGDRFISNVAPTARKFDLLGGYHPEKPWRSVGRFATDGSSHITSSTISVYDDHQLTLPPGIVGARQIDQTNSTDIYFFPAPISATGSNNIFAGGSVVVGNGNGNDVTLTAAAGGFSVNNPTGGNFYPDGTGIAAISGNHGVPGSSARTLAVLTAGTTTGFPVVVSAVPSTHGLMIVQGKVSAAAGIISGEGFTVGVASTSIYTVTYSQAFAVVPAVVVTCIGAVNLTAAATLVSNTGTFVVDIRKISDASALASDFYFIAIGQRGA